MTVFQLTIDDNNGEGWFSSIFMGIHQMFISPVATLIAVAALVAQAREIMGRNSSGALSITGLALQAIVFTLVGISWFFRFRITDEEFWRMNPTRAAIRWYQMVGWATINNLVFAFVQAVLLLVALGQGRTGHDEGETAPLLT